ncbi:hypothetical protein CMALT430_40051 [Carnobacterium maltaromaticum]|nr:hypothetical protein CMALT430_40051 [Carnobacterium maltaromaticum]
MQIAINMNAVTPTTISINFSSLVTPAFRGAGICTGDSFGISGERKGTSISSSLAKLFVNTILFYILSLTV